MGSKGRQGERREGGWDIRQNRGGKNELQPI